MNVPRLPTLRLLSSSAAVAISGALRLHIAFLFSGIEPKIMVYLAGGLIIYATYTLDRTFSSDEDEINRKEFAGSRKSIAIIASAFAFLAGSVVGSFRIKLKGSTGG